MAIIETLADGRTRSPLAAHIFQLLKLTVDARNGKVGVLLGRQESHAARK